METNKASYIDYINYEQKYLSSNKFQKDKEFWQNYLENRPDSITMPTFKKNIKQNFSYKAKRKILHLPSSLIKKMNDFCHTHNVSLFNLFMAVYSIYIGRVNHSNDFILGTPILNRTSVSQKIQWECLLILSLHV